ncbi:hypothetical protein ACWGB8_24210 [Kitasatospora sp. NPDC054939]
MPVEHPSPSERALLAAVESLPDTGEWSCAWVTLAQGRLFTPRPWPASGAPRRGAGGRSFPNALRVARQTNGAYVEGFSYADGTVRAHAWCVDRDGAVLDPTWPPGGSADAYLGVPMTPRFVEAFQQRTLTKTHFVGVLDAQVQAERDADRIRTDGIPDWALVDTGRPLPPLGPPAG